MLLLRYNPDTQQFIGCSVQVFPFLVVLPLAINTFGGSYDATTAGVGVQIMGSPIFWWELIVIYLFTFGTRCDGDASPSCYTLSFTASRGYVWPAIAVPTMDAGHQVLLHPRYLAQSMGVGYTVRVYNLKP